MNEKIIFLCFSIIGLLLINFFNPLNEFKEKTIKQAIEDCEGKVKIKGTIVKSFISKKGKNIALIKQENSTALAVLKTHYLENQNITLYAHLSKYKNSCWFFSEKVIIND